MADQVIRRVGVALLDSDVSLEPELALTFAGSIPIHFARIDYPGTVTSDNLGIARKASLIAMRQLHKTDPDLLIYACTSGSFIDGAASDTEYRELACREMGRPVATASSAVAHSLARIGAHRIGLVSPYSQNVTTRLIDYLTEHGIDVVSTALLFGDSAVDDLTLQSVCGDTLLAACLPVSRDADAVLITCTGIRALSVIEQLETACGVPVISSNAAIARLILDAAPEARSSLPSQLLQLQPLPLDALKGL